MTGLYVRCRLALASLGRRLRPQEGLTAIEYGVFAAFIVLALVGVAILAGPALKNWMKQTFNCIIGGTDCDGKGPAIS